MRNHLTLDMLSLVFSEMQEDHEYLKHTNPVYYIQLEGVLEEESFTFSSAWMVSIFRGRESSSFLIDLLSWPQVISSVW